MAIPVQTCGGITQDNGFKTVINLPALQHTKSTTTLTLKCVGVQIGVDQGVSVVEIMKRINSYSAELFLYKPWGSI